MSKKTLYDQTVLLYQKLVSTGMQSLISGNIYQNRRPRNSQLEDIVINSVNSGTGDIQRGLSNINVYVKDIVQNPSFSQPNSSRLDELSKEVLNRVDRIYGGYYQYRVEMVSQIEEQETGFTYCNIRIQFKFFKSQL